jgi:hypothetical protein
MSNIKIEQKLEEMMRFVYAHFLEGDESLARFMRSTDHNRAKIRHMIRKEVYYRFGCTYDQICKIEESMTDYRPSTTTIWRSVNKCRDDFETYDKAEHTIRRLIDQFEDYWKTFREYSFQERLQHYHDVPHHILSLMMVMIEQTGWVERYRIDGFYREFRELSEEFVEERLSPEL